MHAIIINFSTWRKVILEEQDFQHLINDRVSLESGSKLIFVDKGPQVLSEVRVA